MPNPSPRALPMRPRQTFTFTSTEPQYDYTITLEFRPYSLPLIYRASEITAEKVRLYLGSEEEPAEMPFPPSTSGEAIPSDVLSLTLFQQAAAVYVQQVGEDRMEFDDLVWLAYKCPTIWGELAIFLHKTAQGQEQEKDDPKAPAPTGASSSEPPATI